MHWIVLSENDNGNAADPDRVNGDYITHQLSTTLLGFIPITCLPSSAGVAL